MNRNLQLCEILRVSHKTSLLIKRKKIFLPGTNSICQKQQSIRKQTTTTKPSCSQQERLPMSDDHIQMAQQAHNDDDV